MGFGPPTRRPFAYLSSIGFVSSWDASLADAYDEFIVAIDSNVVLHTVVHKDDAPDEAAGYEEYIKTYLHQRIGGVVHRILAPISAHIGMRRCIQLEANDGRQPRIVVFLGCDNGSPPLKHYARERRQTAKLHSARKLISEPGAVRCFVNELQQVIQRIANVTVVTAKDAPGEGEFSCMRFLNSFGDNSPRRLLLIASSDSDVLLYGILARAKYNYNLGMVVLNASVWRGTALQDRKELQMVNLSAFGQFLLTKHQVDMSAYIFFLAILLGNDFMPSILKTTVEMAQIHEIAARRARASTDISYAAMIAFLKEINAFAYFKAGQKTVVSKADRVEAFEGLYQLAALYLQYLQASCPSEQTLSMANDEFLQQNAQDALCMTTHEAWQKFMSEPPFPAYLLLHRSINNTLWRATLAAIAKDLEAPLTTKL